jgi:hypothetical protein
LLNHFLSFYSQDLDLRSYCHLKYVCMIQEKRQLIKIVEKLIMIPDNYISSRYILVPNGKESHGN